VPSFLPDAPRAGSGRNLDRLARAFEAHAAELAGRRNVHHIGIGLKRVGGKPTARPAVIAFVARKESVRKRDLVPPELSIGRGKRKDDEPVATDVVEMPGRPRLFSLRAGMPIYSADHEQGTAGLVFTHHGLNYLMTNAHVVTDPGNAPGPVGVYLPENGGITWSNSVIAHDILLPGSRVTSDAALVRLDGTQILPWKIYGTEREISGFADISWNDNRVFSYVADGQRLECVLSAVVPEGAPVEVDGQVFEYFGFFVFRAIQGLPKLGHSGALIYTPSSTGLLAAALLFGGVPGQEVWGFPARRCYNQMVAQLPPG
jgi:hypothetical protein